MDVNWKKPDVAPELDCGDRIVMVVREVHPLSRKLFDCLVILEAAENGWVSPDPTYGGYDHTDGVCWQYEREFLPNSES